jgi:hypothetical protein
MPLAIHENPSFYRLLAGVDCAYSPPWGADSGKQTFWVLRCLAYPRTGPPSAYATIFSANCELFVGEVERHEADVGKRSRTSVALASVDPLSTTTGSRLDAGVDKEDAGGNAQAIGRAIDPQSWGHEFVDFSCSRATASSAGRPGRACRSRA